MISRLKKSWRVYPKQFWLLFMIMMLSWLFHSMIWPYIMLYSSQTLEQPLTAVAGLISIFSLAGLVTTFAGGAIADRFGRKWVMFIALVFCALSWFLFVYADSLATFAILMALTGAATPLYRITADSMVTDLIPAEDRIDAYSVIRLGNNLGVAIGPILGGITAAISYDLSFIGVGIGFVLCGALALLFLTESMPKNLAIGKTEENSVKGYLSIFKDKSFLAILGAFSFNRICSSILWLMLAVYAKENFGISEKVYGFIPMTNAVMVIVFQIFITNRVKKRQPISAMTFGAVFYSIAVFGVAFGKGFWMFWLCMVIATIGEMILMPTSTTYISRLAPDNMRARYMSMYTLTWVIGTLVGPLFGGLLSDWFAPAATWIGGGIMGMVSVGLLMIVPLNKKTKRVGEIQSGEESSA